MFQRCVLPPSSGTVRTSETSVDNHFKRQYIPEDNSEQPKSCFMFGCIFPIGSSIERDTGTRWTAERMEKQHELLCWGSHVVFTLDRQIGGRCCKSFYSSLGTPGGRAAVATWVAACHMLLVTQPRSSSMWPEGIPFSCVICVRKYVERKIRLSGYEPCIIFGSWRFQVWVRRPFIRTEVSRDLPQPLQILLWYHRYLIIGHILFYLRKEHIFPATSMQRPRRRVSIAPTHSWQH
jgi:hypothetical protein